MSLATLYRPKSFDQILGQESTIKILKKQIELQKYSNCYLFCGPTGVGKTTLARVFANEVNKGQGNPIEIDAASNNGVDNVRSIIETAKERSIDSEYKIFIIDETHMITNAGWNAFLKCIEEPPKYTIFIFCTTDPQKIPATIINRMMRFNLGRVADDLIKGRLIEILNTDDYDKTALDYIVKISEGSVRNAITNLEKVLSYDNKLTMDNALTALDGYSYDLLFDLINAISDDNKNAIVSSIDKFYYSGKDLKLLIDQLIDITLNLSKYCIFKDVSATNIPILLEEQIKYTTGVFETQEQNIKYFVAMANNLINIKNKIKYDTNTKTTITILLLNLKHESMQI